MEQVEKIKKPRSEAQISATKRALESLQAKRKEQWEIKKKEIISIGSAKLGSAKQINKQAPVLSVALSVAEPSVVATVEEPVESKSVNPKAVNPGTKGSTEGSATLTEWTNALTALSDKVDMIGRTMRKKKIKRVIEESDSSDEEVIVVRKKKILPSAVSVAEPSEPSVVTSVVKTVVPLENPLKRMLFRN